MELTVRSGVNLTSLVRGRVSRTGRCNRHGPHVRGRVSHTGSCDRHGPHGALRCEPNITSERTCVTHGEL
ncbi:hypothetical protein RRG08_040918 [Elysia crispata]|uniref:Uncharacterized protein n=1 Tax=Elysia crispata TaxID=231223 RepID=A0AAE1DKT5_9GAST|nr:hypothetical protein RRG08_040918 [Elysia crispata]